MGHIKSFTASLQNNKEVIIRNPRPEDAAALLESLTSVINEERYLLTAPGELNLSIPQEIEWIETQNNSDNHIFIVAEAEKTIVGGIGCTPETKCRHQHNGLLGIHIVKEWRRVGLGSILLQSLIEWATANSTLEKISLEVYEHNGEAIHLYQKFGFVEEGRRVKSARLKPDHYVDEIVMARFV